MEVKKNTWLHMLRLLDDEYPAIKLPVLEWLYDTPTGSIIVAGQKDFKEKDAIILLAPTNEMKDLLVKSSVWGPYPVCRVFTYQEMFGKADCVSTFYKN